MVRGGSGADEMDVHAEGRGREGGVGRWRLEDVTA